MATPTQWLSEFQVNTGTANVPNVENTQIIGLSNGNFLVAWEEPGTSGATGANGLDIIGKIFDAEGNVVVDSYRLNTDRNAHDEADFSIAATNDGGFIMVYVDDGSPTDNESDIIWERFNSSGAQIDGETIASSASTGNGQLSNPQVVVNQVDNSSFVTWTDGTLTNDDDLRAARLDAAGVITATFEPGFSTGNDNLNSTALNTTGNPVTVYRSDVLSDDLLLREYDASGNLVRQLTIADGNIPTDADPVVAGLANGDIAVALHISGRIFLNTYTPNGGTYTPSIALPEFLVINNGGHAHNDPQIIALPDGDFVVVWDNETTGAFEGQRFNPDATFDGTEFVIDGSPSGDRLGDVGVTADGRLLFSWELNGDVFASIFDPRDGTTIDASDYTTAGGLTGNFLRDGNIYTSQIAGSTINGTSAAETFLGQAGNDTINGGGSTDTIDAGAGDDTIIIGEGESIDIIDGGADFDIVDMSGVTSASGAVTLTGLTASGTYSGFGGTQSIINIEHFIGTQVADDLTTGNISNRTIDGQGGDDIIRGGFDFQRLLGGSGNDTIDGGFYVGSGIGDYLDGGADNDTVIGANGDDQIFGGTGNDILTGNGGEDALNGGTGTDTATYENSSSGLIVDIVNEHLNTGEAAGDTYNSIENLTGSSFRDTLRGDDQVNLLRGGDEVDILLGRGGNDTLLGDDGNDSLFGQLGDDTLIGGEGNDTLHGSIGADSLRGGNGFDVASYQLDNGAVTVDLTDSSGNTGNAAGDTYSFMEHVNGSQFSDIIRANNINNILRGLDGNDVMYGRGGNDAMFGSNGNDLMYGQSGNDAFVGGNGRDTMFGGTGSDTFRIDAIQHSRVGAQADRVMDFSSTDGDRIDVSRIDADTSTGGNQTFTYIGGAAFSGTAGELRFDGNEVFGDVNGDGVADFEIDVTGITDAGDFVL